MYAICILDIVIHSFLFFNYNEVKQKKKLRKWNNDRKQQQSRVSLQIQHGTHFEEQTIEK